MFENQLLKRYEFKYLLTKKIANQIEKEANNFMTFDSFVQKSLNNQYFVRSLYYENNLSSNFFEKVDGMKFRRKYRIRTYDTSFKASVPIFFEMKGRNLERTFKKRMKIDYKYLNFFLQKKHHDKLLNIYPNNQLIRSFVFDAFRKNINPHILVDYTRRPYVNKFGLYFRLTFDKNLFSVLNDKLFCDERNLSWIECKAGLTILEVKFDRSIPAWFHRMIQSYNLKRVSLSKFALGMTTCGVAEETSL